MFASNYTKVVITAEDKTASAFESAKRNIRSISNSSSDLIPLLGGVAAGFYAVSQSVKLISGQSDVYSKFTALLKNSTSDANGFQKALESVNDIARRSQSNVSGVATLYSRLSTSLTDLGVSQTGIARVTETISLGLKASGATAEESSSAMLQLSQAFGSGVLRGEEFNAVNEAAPALLRAIAESISQPVGALRQLASDGKLTSDVLYKAFSDENLLNKFRAQSAEIRTFAGALAPLQNAVTEIAGVFTQKSRAVELFSGAVNGATAAIQIFKAAADGKGIDTSIDKVFSSYSKYREMMDKMIEDQGKVFNGKTNNILPSGSLLSDIPLRKDIGMIGQVDQAFEELKRKAAAFRAENPFKDKQADLDTYNQKISLLNDLEAKGLVSVQESARYRAQFNAGLDKGNKSLTDTYTVAGEVNNKYAEMYKLALSLNQPQESQIDQLTRMMDGFSGMNALAKEWLENEKLIAEDNALEKKLLDQNNAFYSQIDAINESVRATQFEIDTYGKLPSQITDITIARLQDRKATLEGLGLVVTEIEAQIDAYQRLRDVQSGKEGAEYIRKAQSAQVAAAKSSAADIQREYDRMTDNINRSITDALLRGFESGKSFAENFKDTLINMFKSLVLQPVVKLLVDSSGISKIATVLTGTISGTASASSLTDGASSTSSASMISVAKNLYNGITSGFDSLNASLVGKIGDLGTYLVDKGFNNLGGMIGQYNTQIASALPYTQAVFNLLQGNTTGAALSAAGAFLGNLTPLGPIGGAIGASIGSMLGGLFGGGAPLRNWAEVTSKYDTSDTFKVTNTLAKRGGSAVISPLTDLNKAFSQQLDGFMEAMGSDAALRLVSSFSTRPDHDTKAALSGSINGKGFSLGQILYDEDDTKAWSKYVSTVLGKGMVAAIRASNLEQGFKDLFKGFAGQESVGKLMGYVLDFKNASEELMDTYGITAETAAKIARQGGSTNKEILAFTQTFAEFSLGLMKQSEQLLLAKDNITKAMDDIVSGVSTPSSLDAFDSVLAGIDTSTKAGQKQFADLFKLRDTFSEYQSSLDSINSNVYSSLYSLLTPSGQLAEQQKTLAATAVELGIAVPTSADELIKLGQSIDMTTEAGLDLAIAFPTLVTAFSNVQDASDAVSSSLDVSTSRFKTLFDYLNYKALASTYGGTYAEASARASATVSGFGALPSYDVGTSYVPTDGPAMIHAGERILTAVENADIVASVSSSNTSNQALLAEMRAIRQEMASFRSEQQSGMVAVVRETKRGSDTLEKFDRTGTPIVNYNNGAISTKEVVV